MICILHGYLLEGSGSNLWTRSIIQSLCRSGETVHLLCQENHPELYDFIASAFYYHADGTVESLLQREIPFTGRCIMHKPYIGETLPVYVWDRYEEYSDVQPMVNLSETQIDNYLEYNVRVLRRIVKKNDIRVLHANHAVLMSVVAQRVSNEFSIPFSIMPHGSAIEYAVKKDKRLFNLANDALLKANRIFVIGKEIRKRVTITFPDMENLSSKMVDLNLGVDTDLFKLIPRKERQNAVDTLCASLDGVPRGKKTEMSTRLRGGLTPEISKSELKKLTSANSDYSAKCPDNDVEARLRSIDWQNDQILLFVGRLIAAKGVHELIFALPSILQMNPRVKLIVVGHGPLRESLEVLLWALENDARALIENILAWGTALDGSDERPFKEIQLFFDKLKSEGNLDAYFVSARKLIREDSITFTGYLTHRELRHLFPICDAAVFPSIVAEAGPLVFLEALASGCFPIGTYFAGTAASIDSIAGSVPDSALEYMKLSADERETVNDITNKVVGALTLDETVKDTLRRIAVEKYDWQSIGKRFIRTLYESIQ